MGKEICPGCGREKIACCPECGSPVDVYSRIVGYMRPTSTWNPGKQQEFSERKEYQIRRGDHMDDIKLMGD